MKKIKFSDFEKSTESGKSYCANCKHNGDIYGKKWSWCEKPEPIGTSKYTGECDRYVPSFRKNEKNLNGECPDYEERQTMASIVKKFLRSTQ